MTSLTDLEGAALALIAGRGAATSYAVAQAFARSPSEFWSGSAGAVYPMIKRLAARGLLEPRPATDDKRGRLDYQVTRRGRAAMKAWLLDATRAAGLGFDPLRTRLVHLQLVDADQRRAFLDEVRAQFDAIAERPAFPDDPLAAEIHASWLKARAAWLAGLGFAADDQPSAPPAKKRR